MDRSHPAPRSARPPDRLNQGEHPNHAQTDTTGMAQHSPAGNRLRDRRPRRRRLRRGQQEFLVGHHRRRRRRPPPRRRRQRHHRRRQLGAGPSAGARRPVHRPSDEARPDDARRQADPDGQDHLPGHVRGRGVRCRVRDDQAGHRPPGLEPQGAEHRRQPTAGPERLGADRPREARRRDLHGDAAFADRPVHHPGQRERHQDRRVLHRGAGDQRHLVDDVDARPSGGNWPRSWRRGRSSTPPRPAT